MKILLAGESWMVHMTHVKGFDSFTSSRYEEGAASLIQALSTVATVTFLPNHVAHRDFPSTIEELQEFNLVILSDIGSNTLLLPDNVFYTGISSPNRLDVLDGYVRGGGALLMIGGYMSFTGIDGKARYGQTALARTLPVVMSDVDDRMERPQGVVPISVDEEHPALAGLSKQWPALLGYNATALKPGVKPVVTIDEHPLVAVWDYGAGRSGIFSSDCAPHWGSPSFMAWDGYDAFWANFARYLTRSTL